MTTLYKADIFFFVSTIAVGVITILVAVFVWYAISTLKEVRKTLKLVRRQVARASALTGAVGERAMRVWSYSQAFINFINNLKR